MAEVSKRANHSNIVKPSKSLSALSKSTLINNNSNGNKAKRKNKKPNANSNSNAAATSKANATANASASSMANMNSNGNAMTRPNSFVSQCVLWQTNPRKVNYTIYVKIVIHPPAREPQEIRFPYQPDRESLDSVIDELVDALQLDADLHHRYIVHAIQYTMKTTRMRIVRTSPIQSQPSPRHAPGHGPGPGHGQTAKAKPNAPPPPAPPKQAQQNATMKTAAVQSPHSALNAKRKGSYNCNVHQEVAASANNLSPKKHGHGYGKYAHALDSDDEEYLFSPLSPLVVSPRIIHRKSAAKFPNLRIYSQSMSESDPLSLMKQIKYNDEDLCYNSTSNSASNSRRNSQLIDDHYMEKILHHTHNLQEDEEDDDHDDEVAVHCNY